eukprot:CAMPEP_0174269328 /NCGR_PEP_ID=MMETSP0439-20130205/40633_1 /TAXON_ID=0 /ORGANISM="Stereomyxa ramosa, Strain Chinc5" /LENGTH=492 /DNA_ID=CAMNT_0015358045 /DNA_START=31 /DNA_END=1509 /DNA_ORIENTATION=+
MVTIYIIFGLLLLLGFVLFVFIKKTFSADEELAKDIPGAKPSFFWGNVKEIADDTLTSLPKYISTFSKNGICKYYYFTEPIIVLSEPRLIEHVLHTNSKNYEKERDPYLSDMVGNGLLVSQGEFWKRQRRLMVPAFSKYLLIESFPIIVNTADKIIKLWSEKKTINLREEMTKFTLDIISEIAFGAKLNSIYDKDEKLSSAVTEILQETENRVFQKIPIHKIFPFIASARRFNKAKAYIRSTLLDIVQKKRKILEEDKKGDLTKSQIKRMDVLDRLITANDPLTGESMTDKQLVDEAISILLAGHETTANTSAFTFGLLAENPEKEQKLIDEIEEWKQSGKDLDFQSIMNLKYLDAVVKESMRLYPPAAQLADRLVKDDDVIDGHLIPKHTYIEIWPWQLHRDPKLWDKADEFIPERFLTSLDHKFMYLPFSRGPRSCIGQTLAILETKIIIAMVLLEHRLVMAEGAKMKASLTVTLRADNVVMSLCPRLDS